MSTSRETLCILVPYSVLLHVSAVYASHPFTKRIKQGGASPNKQHVKLLYNSGNYY